MATPVRSLFELLGSVYDSERHFDLIRATYEQERWFDSPRQRKAAELVVEALKKGGISDAKLVDYPADGKTMFQDWISHYAWQCQGARIGIHDTGELLGSRAEAPTMTVLFCGPLASEKHPAVSTIVDLDKLDNPTPEQVDGKFVLTSGPQHPAKRKLVRCKCTPLAIVSNWIGNLPGVDENAVKWCNTWSNGPEGWYQHAGDTTMTGFNISVRAGKLLRKRLAANRNLRLSGWCDSRIYEGLGQCPTGVLKGQDPSKEIWLYAHDCEQGATDNCSGVTVITQVLIMLEKLIQAGKLPRPKHSIRMFSVAECLGMVGFITMRDDLRGKALAGYYIDGGIMQEQENWKVALLYGPLSNPGFHWPLAGVLGEETTRLAGEPYRLQPKRHVPTADDMIAEPRYNVPSVTLMCGGTILAYHSNQDTPETILPDGLKKSTVMMAAWAYIMADLGRLGGDFLGPAADWLTRNLAKAGDDDTAKLSRHAAATCLRDLKRYGLPESSYSHAADVFWPADMPAIADLATTGPVYRRKTYGNVTLQRLPESRRPAAPVRWNHYYCAATYWTDGQRSLDAVERLAKAEVPEGDHPPLGPFFEACAEAGNMERVR